MSTPTTDQAQQISDVIDDELRAGDPPSIYDNYSGRGMYGEQVVAFVVEPEDLPQIYIAIGILLEREELPPEAARWFRRSDSMGRSAVVVY